MTHSLFHFASERTGRAWWIALIVLVVVAIAAVVAARNLGRWLVVQDPLAKSGAIVVLSGGLPYRALDAAKIYRDGFAPEVWATRSWHPPAIDEMNLDFRGEEFYSREVLIRQGVPADAIRILPPQIINTEEEIRAISDQMRAEGISRVIIVTSPQHTRRVRKLWRDLAPKGFDALVEPAMTDLYDAQHWWRNTKDADDTMHEVLGLVNAWAGLPVRPLRH